MKSHERNLIPSWIPDVGVRYKGGLFEKLAEWIVIGQRSCK
jgi:hypothetical protein